MRNFLKHLIGTHIVGVVVDKIYRLQFDLMKDEWNKGILENFADQYTFWESQFDIHAEMAGVTPKMMLMKISVMLKGLSRDEILCLYWRLRTLCDTDLAKVGIGRFTDDELDRAIKDAHKKTDEFRAERGILVGPEYRTMRQDTKDSPEDAKMNSDRRLL